jgi:hypothetical protein
MKCLALFLICSISLSLYAGQNSEGSSISANQSTSAQPTMSTNVAVAPDRASYSSPVSTVAQQSPQHPQKATGSASQNNHIQRSNNLHHSNNNKGKKCKRPRIANFFPKAECQNKSRCRKYLSHKALEKTLRRMRKTWAKKSKKSNKNQNKKADNPHPNAPKKSNDSHSSKHSTSHSSPHPSQNSHSINNGGKKKGITKYNYCFIDGNDCFGYYHKAEATRMYLNVKRAVHRRNQQKGNKGHSPPKNRGSAPVINQVGAHTTSKTGNSNEQKPRQNTVASPMRARK